MVVIHWLVVVKKLPLVVDVEPPLLPRVVVVCIGAPDVVGVVITGVIRLPKSANPDVVGLASPVVSEVSFPVDVSVETLDGASPSSSEELVVSCCSEVAVVEAASGLLVAASSSVALVLLEATSGSMSSANPSWSGVVKVESSPVPPATALMP